jgi:hypothetical protein
MNSIIKLPSGKILDLNRFVALFPEDETTSDRYSLILEGCSYIIHLDRSEADAIEKYLNLEPSHYKNTIWDRQVQLQKNQPAIDLLKKRIEKHKLMSEEESNQRSEFFADFQKTIDAERSTRKLYDN